MAAHHKCLKYIDEILDLAGYDIGYNVCQLGSCGFRLSSKGYLKGKYGIECRKLSSYLSWYGFEVATIDIDGGKRHLPIDLGVPIEDESLFGSFDLVIGFAFIEHIENQYELFKNIHNLCKVGGMVILNCPAVGSYPGHGTWTYDFKFFDRLFMACGYGMLDIRMMSLKYFRAASNKVMVYTSYSKTEGSKFVERENFKLPHYDPVGHEVDKGLYNGCKRSEEVG